MSWARPMPSAIRDGGKEKLAASNDKGHRSVRSCLWQFRRFEPSVASILLLVQLGDDDKPGALVLVVPRIDHGLAFADGQCRFVNFLAFADELYFNFRPFQFLDFNGAI